MNIEDYSGYWIGEIDGTNKGKITATLNQRERNLTGIAKISEPALGQYECQITGTVADNVSLTLTPLKIYGNFGLGIMTVIGMLNQDGKLSGRWESTIGTEGVFSAKRANTQELASTLPDKNSIFIVHGHDEAAKQGVARFLEQLGVAPVILHEQINRGMTLIEKFEKFAERAGFAVILITPDDYGYPVTHEQSKQLRPRQNVLLELGYFFAKLGREKTFVLKKGKVEMPSDIFGIVYEPLDEGEGWKIRLARELKAAGFNVDFNKAI